MYNFINKDDIYHLIVNRTAMAFSRELNANFKRNGVPISKEQFSILVVLWKQEGCSQQFLAEQTYRDKPGITRLLDNLAKDGFLERRPDKYDRRTNLVFLTEKGKDLEEKVTQVVNDTIKTAVKGFGNKDVAMLKRLLEAVFNNLN